MPAMFHQLLEASISYLEDLKRHGTRHVRVRRETLEGFRDVRVPSEPLLPELVAPLQRALLGSEPVTSSLVSIAGGGAVPSTPSYEFEPAPEPMPEPNPPPRPDPEIQSSEVASAVVAEESLFAPAPEAELGPMEESLMAGQSKAGAIASLRERAMVCVKCSNLANSRKNVVFGVGNIDAELMFVGEAPGSDEDAAGEPFVGKAGQLLTRIIQTMGLSREGVYIANILKCRPDTPGQPSGNRKPTGDEMKTCSPYLHAQVDLIRPKVLVALGATAIEGLLGPVGGITRLRGNWKTFRGIPLMPTYHPAYLLHNQALQEKRKVWEDMLLVMEKLGLELTDKHRGYFQPR